MKKLFLISLLSLVAVSMFGQRHYFGVQTGVAATRTHISYPYLQAIYQESSLVSFRGGFTYQYRFGRCFQVGADLLYAKKGQNLETLFEANRYSIFTKTSYHYLSIPIKWGVSTGKRFGGVFNVGLVPSLLLSGISDSKTDSNSITVGTIPITKDTRKIDLGGLFEVGLRYRLNDHHEFYSTAAYQRGLTNISVREKPFGEGVKHDELIISVGFRYGLN